MYFLTKKKMSKSNSEQKGNLLSSTIELEENFALGDHTEDKSKHYASVEKSIINK